MKIRKNDTVLVLTGKERGKRGKVYRVNPSANVVVVEGLNMFKRHMKPKPGLAQAGIIEREAPIHISNLMLICPSCNEAVKAGTKRSEEGKKVRVCKSCQEEIK